MLDMRRRRRVVIYDCLVVNIDQMESVITNSFDSG